MQALIPDLWLILGGLLTLVCGAFGIWKASSTSTKRKIENKDLNRRVDAIQDKRKINQEMTDDKAVDALTRPSDRR